MTFTTTVTPETGDPDAPQPMRPASPCTASSGFRVTTTRLPGVVGSAALRPSACCRTGFPISVRLLRQRRLEKEARSTEAADAGARHLQAADLEQALGAWHRLEPACGGS